MRGAGAVQCTQSASTAVTSEGTAYEPGSKLQLRASPRQLQCQLLTLTAFEREAAAAAVLGAGLIGAGWRREKESFRVEGGRAFFLGTNLF